MSVAYEHRHDYPACALFGRGPHCTCDAKDHCPKCGSVEWDHITSERGMHPSDLPINRCPCGHSWSPE